MARGTTKSPNKDAATITIATAKRSIKRRRRAGIVFGTEPIAIDLAALTAEQLAAIEADPALKVERGMGEGAGGAAPTG